MRRLPFTLVLGALGACDYVDPSSYPPVSPPDDCVDLGTPDGYVKALSCQTYKSCALQCSCSEPESPYVCPALRPWGAMEHAAACGSFDGLTMPAPTQGKCTASAPFGIASASMGLASDVPGRIYLPDGHFIEPAGHDQEIVAPDVLSSFATGVVLVPGTPFAVVVDGGVRDNALYSIDLDALDSGKNALVSDVKAESQFEAGLAFVAPNRLLVSGGADGKVYGYTIDGKTGALARDASHDIDLGPSSTGRNRWYAAGLEVTKDGASLVVSSAASEGQARIVDLATMAQRSVDLMGSRETFGPFLDPFDPSGTSMWISSIDGRALYALDFAGAKVKAHLKTGKNPEGIAFLGAGLLAAASSDDDTITLYDSVAETTLQTLDVSGTGAPRGAQPGAMAFDDASKRLYVTESGLDALGVYAFDATGKTLSPLGKIPTSWFPTAVRVRADGGLVIVSAKGHGTGPALTQNTPELTRSAIAHVPMPSASDLYAMTSTVDFSRQSTSEQGFPAVSCDGAPYDFPIPATNDAPSTKIQHIVYVIRENKTFDSVFGDLPGVNGDPQAVMSPGKMDEYWHNARAIARAFTNFDNYGISAEQSLQGHVWTSFGRTTDWIERTWSSTWGRSVRLPTAGLDKNYGSPAEGGLFSWLDANKVDYDDMGEVIGAGNNGFDPNYPGLVYSQLVPDQEKSCYIAARARALCDLKAVSYVVLPNDHTKGTGSPTDPTPELMIAVNDVATGMILDALSHSPLWPSTLLVVTEDDPQDGQDHVDGHRTPLFLASPWVKRGYVSHTRIDTASLHKLFAHILGKPYNNARVAEAAVPFDAFTSTPDYTPFSYTPLQTKVSCNPPGKTSWTRPGDFDAPDQTPWIRGDLARHMRSLGQTTR